MAKVANVRTIRTRANGGWTIVKIETDRPGLYGIGSASDPVQTPAAVEAVIEQRTPAVSGTGYRSRAWRVQYTNVL